MRFLWIGFGVAACSAVSALESPTPPDVKTLLEQYEAADIAWRGKITSPGPNHAGPSPAIAFSARFRALAQREAGSAEGLTALTWIVGHVREANGFMANPRLTDDARWALRQLTEHYLKDPEIGAAVETAGGLRFMVGPEAVELVELFERVGQAHPDKEIRAFALFQLGALYCYDRGERTDATRDRAADRRRGEDFLRKTVKDYPGTYGSECAAPCLFEIEYLQVGHAAPDAESVDVNGDPIRLSQFRGKVIVLDFWGFWCGACVAMIPEQRDLVRDMNDQPFVLIGINSDAGRRSALKERFEKEGVTWPNFMEGRSRSISGSWNIRGFPMQFIIDHEGVIRHRGQMDVATVRRHVQPLLKAAGGK
jgi:thiol-disulfide isomerase/thioredoxin